MLKKIILIFILIFSFFIGNNVFAKIATERGTLPDGTIYNPGDEIPDDEGGTTTGGPDDISSTDFTIYTDDFSVGGAGLKGGDSTETINITLGTIIRKLMIALGVISLFVMTVGTGYMIMYHGQDEFLTKGKNIFIGGIISLFVALSSYYLVNLVGYILYK